MTKYERLAFLILGTCAVSTIVALALAVVSILIYIVGGTIYCGIAMPDAPAMCTAFN